MSTLIRGEYPEMCRWYAYEARSMDYDIAMFPVFGATGVE